MIIDEILERHDDELYGIPYNAYKSLKYMYDMAMDMEMFKLAQAIDCGEEEDIRRELCNYIDDGQYNPAIKNYINSRVWGW